MSDHHFTGDLRYVADIVGPEIAQALKDNLLGIEVKIPKTWSKNSVLTKLDRETADILIAHFPGDVLYVPTGKISSSTKKKAYTLRKEGKTNTEIALSLGVTERHVRGLLNSDPRLPRKHDLRQIDMFSSEEDDE